MHVIYCHAAYAKQAKRNFEEAADFSKLWVNVFCKSVSLPMAELELDDL